MWSAEVQKHCRPVLHLKERKLLLHDSLNRNILRSVFRNFLPFLSQRCIELECVNMLWVFEFSRWEGQQWPERVSFLLRSICWFIQTSCVLMGSSWRTCGRPQTAVAYCRARETILQGKQIYAFCRRRGVFGLVRPRIVVKLLAGKCFYFCASFWV